MSTTITKSTSEVPVNLVVEPVRFYATFSFWMILVAIVLLIIIGFVLFYFTPTPAGGFTLIGFYIFSILLLIIGILIAIM